MTGLVYGSVCSGIEAATVAWHPLGWRPAWFAEIDTFPSAVLAHRFPEVPNHGDFTRISAADGAGIDLLVGGTPCQSFSVAGLRGGLADERGNLALEFLRLADRCAPRWIVWENVPGVLSSNGGRDFGSFVGALAELGYGWAYRVLDAQYFGVPQRRRRVFVVGCLGDTGHAPAAVLFEPESVRGRAPKGVEKGASVAARAARCAYEAGIGVRGRVAHTLTSEGADASEDGTGRGTPIVTVPAPFTFDTTQITSPHNRSNPRPGQPCHTLPASGHPPALTYALLPEPGQGADLRFVEAEVAPTLTASAEAKKTDRGVRVVQPMVAGTLTASYSNLSVYDFESGNYPLDVYGVRRLTPLECERLQGFPDGYTAIPGAKDAPRYKAIGNSMAVPVMRWIGERIQACDAMRRSA